MAKKLYDFKLEPELIKAHSRDGHKNKIALLRDFCLSLGVKIRSVNYDLIDSAEESKMVTTKNEAQKSKTVSKKQAAQDYESLPFQTSHIVELVPQLTHLEIINKDFDLLLLSVKNSLREGYFDQAFEFLNQAININLQIAGPINKEAATCLALLANVHFKFGEYMQLFGGEANKDASQGSFSQAIQLQYKAIILYEKLYGKVHNYTAQAYQALHKFSLKMGQHTKAFKYLHRALYIYEIICGENHPEISTCYISLGYLYLDVLGKSHNIMLTNLNL